MATLSPLKERFAQALTRELPGLNISVARAWTAAEVGDYNLNLGIMDAPGDPHKFPTPEAGAAAAADLIKRSSNYAGIRSSLSSADPNVQASAIAQSPWHLGGRGLAAAGGTDPYYKRIFEGWGLKVGGTPTGNIAGPIAANTPGTTNTAGGGEYGDKFIELLKKSGISTDPNHVITADEAAKIVANFGTVYGGGARPMASNFTGKTVGAQTTQMQSSGQAIADAPANLAGLPGEILGFAVGRFFLIFGGILCIGVGIWIVLHETPNRTDPALLKVLQGGKGAGAAVA